MPDRICVSLILTSTMMSSGDKVAVLLDRAIVLFIVMPTIMKDGIRRLEFARL